MTAQNRHLTTEQLSAYLDDELSTEEQARCEAHLHTCKRCQQALVVLRETATLLHALPQPSLPRSFLLTENMLTSAPSETKLPHVIGSVPRSLAERRAARGWSRATLMTMRSLTALAAIFGLVFLLSSFSLHGQMNGASSTGTMSSNTTGSANSSTNSSTGINPQYQATHAAQAAQRPSPTPSSVIAQPTPTRVPAFTSSNTTHSSGSSLPWLALNNSGTRALLGLFLLFLAVLGVLLLRHQRQMTRAG